MVENPKTKKHIGMDTENGLEFFWIKNAKLDDFPKSYFVVNKTLCGWCDPTKTHFWHHQNPELGYPAAAADSDKTTLGSVLDRPLGEEVERPIWSGQKASIFNGE